MPDTGAPNPATGYPCPDCVMTMLPGVTYTFPLTRGAGKIRFNPSWNWPSGSFVPNQTLPPDELLECRRCAGSGLVADRRRGSIDRRKSEESSRTGWFVEGRIDTDTRKPYVHVELHSRGVKAQTDTGVRAELEAVIRQLQQARDATWPAQG